VNGNGETFEVTLTDAGHSVTGRVFLDERSGSTPPMPLQHPAR